MPTSCIKIVLNFRGETAKLICECDNTLSEAAINSINVNIVHK